MYLTYIIIERYIIGGYSFIKNAIVLGGRKLSLRILKTLICLGTILKLSPKLYESINNSIISVFRIRNFLKKKTSFFFTLEPVLNTIFQKKQMLEEIFLYPSSKKEINLNLSKGPIRIKVAKNTKTCTVLSFCSIYWVYNVPHHPMITKKTTYVLVIFMFVIYICHVKHFRKKKKEIA